MNRSLRRRCARVARLSPHQRWLTAEAAALLLAALVLRRCLSARRLLQLSPIENRSHPHWRKLANRDADAVAERLAALECAARALPLCNCLVKATALRLLLRRADIASTLHIGVRRTDDRKLATHAWVSIGGRIILGANELVTAYAELLREAPAQTNRSGALLP